MSREPEIQTLIDRGYTRKQACMTLGVPFTPVAATIDKIDKDALRDMAIETLHDLIISMRTSPSAYKPNEIIAACKEALDRSEGKPSQSIAVSTRQTVTHEHILSLSPVDAYKMMIASDAPVIEGVFHNVDRVGGDGGEQAGG